MSRPRITCITPVFNEVQNLDRYAEAVRRVLFADVAADWRVLFVDDGSRDASWAKLKELCAADARFTAIRLSRNFGPHTAIGAALDSPEAGDSDAVCILAADLQDPPEALLAFADKWRAGARVVWGQRRRRGDEGWRVLASRLFNFVLKRYAMPRDSKFTTGSFLLVDRIVVEALRSFPEHGRITFALVAWSGFEQEVVEYDRAPRLAGESGWSVGRMFRTMYDAILGFSQLPAQIFTGLALLLFSLCLGLGAYVLFNWLTGTPVPGWTSLTLMLCFFFGLQFSTLGIMGEYLARIHTQVLRRPLYFISQRLPAEPGRRP